MKTVSGYRVESQKLVPKQFVLPPPKSLSAQQCLAGRGSVYTRPGRVRSGKVSVFFYFFTFFPFTIVQPLCAPQTFEACYRCRQMLYLRGWSAWTAARQPKDNVSFLTEPLTATEIPVLCMIHINTDNFTYHVDTDISLILLCNHTHTHTHTHEQKRPYVSCCYIVGQYRHEV